MMYAGVDIGGTKVRVGLFGTDGNLLADRKLKTAEVSDFPATLRETLSAMCAERGEGLFSLSSVGIGIPGTVSPDGKRIVKVPNIENLKENLGEELEKVLGVPVFLMQDSRAAAWGEYLRGGGQGAKCLVCLTLGTGLGTGIVMDGKIYNGALGCAGELGHLPTVPDGRPCGCGKHGCLEKYAAGRGLDLTAGELLGEGKTAADLFREAQSGNADAGKAISEAVRMLGDAVCAIVNLLSPDRILFSGGLAGQEERFLFPIIDYVKEHCYSSGNYPVLAGASLGEDAPLIGAGLIPLAFGQKTIPEPEKGKRQFLSASIMCADALNLGKAIDEIAEAGIDYLHCDIMDNHFVPNLMLPPELLNRLRAVSPLPFDYHIMAENPESIIDRLDIRAGDYVSVHVESTVHLEKAISAIRQKGGLACAAINPATPIESIREVLSELSMVLVMTVNPGFAGQKLVPGALDKISRMRKFLAQEGYGQLPIEVDGNCSFENVPRMAEAGADIFVVGTSSVFARGMTVGEGTRKLREIMKMK